MIFMMVSLIILGLVLLVVGSEFIVPSSQRIAHRFKVPEIIIGLTFLGIGSSLPEIATNIKVALSILDQGGSAGIAIGNVIGSCISQISLVAGIAALTAVLHINKKTLRQDGAVMIFAVVLTFLVSSDLIITRVEGVMLVLIYIAYLVFLTQK